MGTRNLRSFGLCGGGTRDRTADLLHAMQALSQLSYTPARKKPDDYREYGCPAVKGWARESHG
jgi:hypothetical protein